MRLLHPSLTAAAATAALATSACSDDVDLEGVYRVESSVASEPCGSDLPEADPPAFLKFTRGELLGRAFYSYAECTDAAATDCASSGGLLEGLFEPRDDGWSGTASFASGIDGNCSLGLDERSATLAGATITVESHAYRQEGVDVRCDPAEAEARGRAMPCVAHEQIIATRL